MKIQIARIDAQIGSPVMSARGIAVDPNSVPPGEVRNHIVEGRQWGLTPAQRAEFKTAFAAWVATNPFGNSDAPSSPFEMPQFRLRAETRADRLEVAGAADSNQAKDANQRANNYMLAVVLLATALFFAGLSTKLESETAQRLILGLGWVVFLGALVWLATLPVEVTT